jgi:Tfp pilus assembly protein PilX
MNTIGKTENHHRTFARRPDRNARRGVTIIIVLAFFAIAITMLGVWVRAALTQRRQMQRWHQRAQATWLADAGVRRAAARLAGEGTAYQGERWYIGAGSLGGEEDAEVAIRIEHGTDSGFTEDPTGESSRRVRIVATADYPAGPRRRVRFTKTTEIILNIPGEQP